MPDIFANQNAEQDGAGDDGMGAGIDSELLRTIKLQRNVFNLVLPEP